MNYINNFITKVENKEFRVLRAFLNESTPLFQSFSISNVENSKSLIIFGKNVSGKTLIGKLLQGSAQQDNVSVRNCSMGIRTSSGTGKALIYGDESEQSTGATSVKVLELCIKSSLKDEGESIIILDEPDLGLSPKYSRALGKFIAKKINNADDDKFITIVSHNAVFLKAFNSFLDIKSSYVGINTEESLDEWVNSDEIADIDSLLSLSDMDTQKWKAIQRAIKAP